MLCDDFAFKALFGLTDALARFVVFVCFFPLEVELIILASPFFFRLEGVFAELKTLVYLLAECLLVVLWSPLPVFGFTAALLLDGGVECDRVGVGVSDRVWFTREFDTGVTATAERVGVLSSIGSFFLFCGGVGGHNTEDLLAEKK
jgi:hypothetical protein